MKPFQIGLLVLVGALGGALIMKFTQRPKPAPIPIARAAPVPAPVPVAPAPAAPAPESPKPVTTAPPVRNSEPARRTHPAATTVAQNLPPAQAPAPPVPAPVQEPSAPPATAEPVPAPVATPAPAVESEEPPAPQPAPSVTLQGGMTLQVRLGESLSSEHNQAGDTFTATLDAPLSAGGFVIAERGARVEGRVVEAQKSGHVKGKATLALELTNLNTSDGQHVAIKTETLRKQGTTMATGDQVGVVAAAAGGGGNIRADARGGHRRGGAHPRQSCHAADGIQDRLSPECAGDYHRAVKQVTLAGLACPAATGTIKAQLIESKAAGWR